MVLINSLINYEKLYSFDFLNHLLCYWDTCGEERYKSITYSYYKEALGVFVVYDITSIKSFNSIDYWISDIKDNCENKNIVIVLLGNKCDLEDKRAITEEQEKEKANEYKIIFFEVSSKTKKGLNEAFSYMEKNIYDINKEIIENEEMEVIECRKEYEECCFII